MNAAFQEFFMIDYFVDTVGRDREKIRRYIQNQEAEDRRLDQLEWTDPPPQQTDRKQK